MTPIQLVSLAMTISLVLGGCGGETLSHAQRQESLSDDQRIRVRQDTAALVRAMTAGDYGEVIRLADGILTLIPDDPRMLHFIGQAAFMDGDMNRCIESYDRLIHEDPEWESRCWQRGLAYYYAGRFELGKQQFESHQQFNSEDVENAVWHLLCSARTDGLENARKKMIQVTTDDRVPMNEIFELFAGRGSPQQVMEAARNLKPDEAAGLTPAEQETQRRTQLYFAHLYIGLFQEMVGQPGLSQASMRSAAAICPLSKSVLMGQVAAVHLRIRTDP